ncbi:hypothetical protein BCV72DRAFT_122798 [Rhizopus microsporus var. microsporus]|uniref:Uncharacterized protein n=1 Tax=Rhizopus microsporus var. microsporus TaxID=86635 RepID=A0A1X0RGJ2_RHIZD|nr:hypothetical protein BCV72DRAFT_122798 [Rhizopus microsporus var. microsporus]
MKKIYLCLTIILFTYLQFAIICFCQQDIKSRVSLLSSSDNTIGFCCMNKSISSSTNGFCLINCSCSSKGKNSSEKITVIDNWFGTFELKWLYQ